MSSSDPRQIGNTRETLAAVLRDLRAQGLPCDIFGGWAEELLGLREPWEHQDIDLVYRGDSLAAFDAIRSDFSPVPLKRFHHKRAFIVRNVLCEIILIQDAKRRPVTHYWGDVPFYWDQPLLHPQAIALHGEPVPAISAENLQRHRRLHRETQPDRWRDPKSLVR
jgi:hypothetical protein